MEEDKPPPYVQYHSTDASVKLVDADRALSQASPKVVRRRRCTSAKSLAIALAFCLMITLAALTLLFLQRFELSPKAQHLKSTVATGITNLSLMTADNRYVTVIWDRPHHTFDFYLLDVTVKSGNRSDTGRKPHSGFCANGTVIHAEETQVTCGPFDACSSITVTVRTFSQGPPEHTSVGATLKDVFIGGQGPSEPHSITMVSKTSHTTQILWGPPRGVDGILDVYNVKVCEKTTTCDEQENLTGCFESAVSHAWLEFNSTADTSYCVFVSATARCGENLLKGTRAAQEIRTPLFALPDVKNLNLVAADNHYVTLAWDQPQVNFDYYWLEVTGGNALGNDSLEKHRPNSCSNGTIIRPEQTQVTCGPFDACSSVSVTVRTYSRGPPELTSMGITLNDLFIDGQEASEPKNIIMLPISPSLTRLQWEVPTTIQGTLDVYKVKVCKSFIRCNRKQNQSDCLEYETSDAWLDISSTPDTKYCVVITARARCGRNIQTGLPGTQEITTPLFDLPDVTDIRLLSAVDNSITVSWQRPQARFDYYWVSITDKQHGNNETSATASCANGTIIHPNQTRVTCTNLEPCTTVNITIRVHRNGPKEHTSRGASLTGIFVPGEDPDPPKNISMVGISASLTHLQWEPSAKVSGRFLEYNVKICTTFKHCRLEANLSGCTELRTHDNWLDFRSNVDTVYCVLVRTVSQCAEHVLNGHPATAELRAPLFELPDVSNLTTAGVKNGYITVSWQRPQGRFDYYSIEVIENGSRIRSQQNLGLCANGTIIRPDQTQLTCGPFEPCTTLLYTMRTHLNGPQERSSSGVTVKDIFIPAEEPHPPRNITMVPTSSSQTQLQWDHPDKLPVVIKSYNVKICRTFRTCGQTDNLSNCTEHVTSETSITFNSTEDTAYCVLVMAKARCGMHEIGSRTAVAEIRTPIVVPPDVTNLRLVSVGANAFTAAWTRPKVSFDYYWIEVIGVSNNGIGVTPGTIGSCVNGSIIHPYQTQVTCSQLQPCSKVNFKIRTHISGPPARTSYGVVLDNILIPASVRPEVTNLQLGAADDDIFVLQWERPKTCFDYYTIEVIEQSTYKSSPVTCNNGSVINPSQMSVTCDQIKTCANVSIRVRTHTRGPPERSSTGAVLRHVFLQGKAPPEPTNLKLVAAEGDSFTVSFQVKEDCFNWYWYDAYINKSSSGVLLGRTCKTQRLAYNHHGLTCAGIQTCDKVDFKLWAGRKGPPRRYSTAAILPSINIRGKC